METIISQVLKALRRLPKFHPIFVRVYSDSDCDSRSPTWVKWTRLPHDCRKSELHSAVSGNLIDIYGTVTERILWDERIMQDGRLMLADCRDLRSRVDK